MILHVPGLIGGDAGWTDFVIVQCPKSIIL
jgi:hypothetical protein